MQYLLDNPRILFVLATLAIAGCLVLLMAGVYWIIEKLKSAKPAAGHAVAARDLASQPALSPEERSGCCAAKVQAGACPCR